MYYNRYNNKTKPNNMTQQSKTVEAIESSVDAAEITVQDLSDLIDELPDEDLQLLPESELTDEEVNELFNNVFSEASGDQQQN